MSTVRDDLIGCMSGKDCTKCKYNGNRKVLLTCFKLAEDILDELPVESRSKWISVTDRLPECEPGAEVGPLLYRSRTGTVYAGYYGTFGKYRDKYFRQYHDGNEGIDASDVTHWMPISDPTEEGTK